MAREYCTPRCIISSSRSRLMLNVIDGTIAAAKITRRAIVRSKVSMTHPSSE